MKHDDPWRIIHEVWAVFGWPLEKLFPTGAGIKNVFRL